MSGEQQPQQPARLVRSYQGAFRLELQLYKLGPGWRLPKPVPARAVLYAFVVWPAVIGVSQLPVLGLALHQLGWEIEYGAVPLALTWLFATAEVEGRRFHLALRAWTRHWLSAKQLAGGWRPMEEAKGAWRSEPVVLISDGRCGEPPDRLRLEGPGAVHLRYPCQAQARGDRLTIRQTSGLPCPDGKLLRIAAEGRVRFTAQRTWGAE